MNVTESGFENRQLHMEDYLQMATAEQEEYAGVIKMLRKGYPIRMIAKSEGVGISTVMRIKKKFIDN